MIVYIIQQLYRITGEFTESSNVLGNTRKNQKTYTTNTL